MGDVCAKHKFIKDKTTQQDKTIQELHKGSGLRSNVLLYRVLRTKRSV